MVSMLLVAWAIARPASARAKARRLASIKSRHATASEAAVSDQVKKLLSSRAALAARQGSLFARLVPGPADLALRIDAAGKDWTPNQFYIVSGAVGVVPFLGLWIYGFPFLMALILGACAGLVIPRMVLTSLVKRRLNGFVSRFPDAIELLVRGLRAGLPISETIGAVGAEIEGPVGEEFRTVADRMKIGRTMEGALQDTADRIGTAEFQFFVITLAIQRETGGNLAETLSNLADVLRKRMQMKLKISAMSSESKASAYIIGALPFVVFGLISFISPNYMGGFFHDTRLMIAGGVGLIWMSIGAFIMREMINFEI
ncbi:type II secretion system F family protein [Sphingomonas montanisoli]|uniref:Type II secretion system F family protein n=1 Tax=Sphingomonas montanisoli TaxID=2606412 RepID=A0A5D9CET1_9SPHN|nr:type II secretion system F family protein [Sphingomonas montanisoli]TZG29673.1 type II secretion system F family protein [Sphingomonas montanisoli]